MKRVYIDGSSALIVLLTDLLKDMGYPFERCSEIKDADLVIVDPGFNAHLTRAMRDATQLSIKCLVLGTGRAHSDLASSFAALFYDMEHFDVFHFGEVIQEAFEDLGALHHRQAA